MFHAQTEDTHKQKQSSIHIHSELVYFRWGGVVSRDTRGVVVKPQVLSKTADALLKLSGSSLHCHYQHAQMKVLGMILVLGTYRWSFRHAFVPPARPERQQQETAMQDDHMVSIVKHAM